MGNDRVKFATAERVHLEQVHRDMREADRRELTASNGPDILRTLEQALEISSETMVAHDVFGRALCVFGLAPHTLSSTRASPWLVGTDALLEYKGVLARAARLYTEGALRLYPVLSNYVDVRNRRSVVWLRRIGFNIEPPVRYGVEGRMFHRFHMTRGDL